MKQDSFIMFLTTAGGPGKYSQNYMQADPASQ